jgi:DNA-binding NtrC family response regulator
VDQQVEMLHVNDVLGIDLHALVGLYAASQRQQIKLPSGLSIWVKAFMQGSQGASNFHITGASAAAQTSQTSQMQASATLSAPPLKPSPSLNAEDCAPLSPAAQSHNDCISSLAQSQQRLIGQTLIDQHGNVAKTARLLGVSRGLVYRHMRKDQADKGVSSSSNS